MSTSWTPGVVPGRNENVKIGAQRGPAGRSPDSIVYSRGITLLNAEGIKLARSKRMADDAANDFFRRMVAALDAVRALPSGRAMMSEIDGSGHTLQIIRGPDGWADGSCVIPYPGDMKSAEGRFVKQFRPMSKVKTDAMASQGGWVKPKQAYTSELKKLLDRVQAKNGRFNRQFIASMIGVPPRMLEEMEAGTRAIEDNEYYRLCLYLYDELTPGGGTSAEMRVVFTQESLPDEPLYLIVGHELVHAWRMMLGRRIFENGWEEEAMTTGLPPFSGIKYSENKLRIEAKVPMRQGYSKICSTSLLNAIRDLSTQPAREDRPFPERDIVGKAGKPFA